MAIITDLKNALRKAIYDKDNEINFYFNEIIKVKFPYVFFYIPSFKLQKALNCEHWVKLNLMCVIEYAPEEDPLTADLWEYSDILFETYSLFNFSDTKISAQNIEFKTVEGVLQMTFDLEFYIKNLPSDEEAELMKELDLTIKEFNNGNITTKI